MASSRKASRKGTSAGFGFGAVLAFGAVCMLAGILLGQSALLPPLAASLHTHISRAAPSSNLGSWYVPSLNLLGSHIVWSGNTSVVLAAASVATSSPIAAARSATAAAAAYGWGVMHEHLLSLFGAAELQHSSPADFSWQCGIAAGCSSNAAYPAASSNSSTAATAAAIGTQVLSSCSPTALLLQPAATCSPHVDVLACPHDTSAPFRRMLQQLADIGLTAEEVSCMVDAGAGLAWLLQEVVAAGPSAAQVSCSFDAGTALRGMLQGVAAAEEAARQSGTAHSDPKGEEEEGPEPASSLLDAAWAVLKSPQFKVCTRCRLLCK